MTRLARTSMFLVLACLLAITTALAQDGPSRIELSPGLAVERCSPPPSPVEPPQCWQPVGFTFGRYGVLRYARTFTRSRAGRIFATIPDNPSQLAAARMAPVVFTDDLGATWQEAMWDPPVGAPALGTFRPLAISADPAGTRVVAAGEYARIWISNDGGLTFTQRRRGGQTYIGVEVLGRAIVLTDLDGRVWLTADDGSSLQRILGDRVGSVTREEQEIVVRREGTTLRVNASGSVRRGR